MPARKALEQIDAVCRELEQPDRLLPGGYLYMTDLLGQPRLMQEVGRMFATAFARSEDRCHHDGGDERHTARVCDGRNILNLPVVIVRRDHKVTEGSAVSINYVSGSTKRIQTMSLARRALKEQSRVLIIDDFMKAGGTIQGMVDLLNEFRASSQASAYSSNPAKSITRNGCCTIMFACPPDGSGFEDAPNHGAARQLF